MRLNLVAHLIKEDFSEEDALDYKKTPERIGLLIKEYECGLYLKKTNSEPRWAGLFKDVPGVSPNIFLSDSVKGILLVRVGERLVAFTFGHARGMIKPEAIERGFGLRVALNLGDPEKIKSIDKSTLEKVALHTRSQTSRNTVVDDFDFEFDQEILKSICAIVDSSAHDPEMVSGCDSVSLYTSIDLDDIPDVAVRLLNSYHSLEYRKSYPWVDFIQSISDPVLIHGLNEALLLFLNAEDFDRLWISPPEIVDYSDFSGFLYKARSVQQPCLHSELDLDSYLKEVRVKFPISLDFLKRREIKVCNADGLDVKSWSLYSCMNTEVDYLNETYILNDGRWYRVDKDFAVAVNDFFAGVKMSGISFPPYGSRNEGEYLEGIADGESFALLDRKLISPKGAGSRIEFCDLLSQCNAMVHVKKYGSSSVLSHLFSQASVSADVLMNDVSIQEQVNFYLDDTYLSLKFDRDEVPRRYRVVLAIMQKKSGPLHLPFFSKVNLRHHVRRMRNMLFEVELAKIPIS